LWIGNGKANAKEMKWKEMVAKECFRHHIKSEGDKMEGTTNKNKRLGRKGKQE